MSMTYPNMETDDFIIDLFAGPYSVVGKSRLKSLKKVEPLKERFHFLIKNIRFLSYNKYIKI